MASTFKLIKIGIIGDIGSGKSHIAKLFGLPVFNADREVKKIYSYNKNCFFRLKKAFPRYIKSFPVKKRELVAAILNQEKSLQKISKIVHPLVRIKMRKFLIFHKKKRGVVLDIPLLLENKLNQRDCVLVYIDANKLKIKKNLKKRKNYNPNILKKLKKLQLPLEKKKKKAHYFIKNNFKNTNVKKSVKLVLKKIFKK